MPTTPIFPLPLSPFEAYMVADDSPRYPMTVVVAAEFEGIFEPGALQAAVDEILPRHPLLSSRVIRTPHGHAWEPVAGASCPVTLLAADDPPPQPPARIDLTRQVGLRLHLRQAGSRAEVVMVFHHACTDAQGGVTFLADVLAAYATRVDPDHGSGPPARDLELLRTRATLGGDGESGTATAPGLGPLITEAWRWLRGRPAPIAPETPGPSAEEPEPWGFPEFQHHTFGVDETAALRRLAHARDASLNDLLLAELMMTISAWNEENGGTTKDPLRVCMPQTLRDDAAAPAPAMNAIGYSFLTRDSTELRDPDALLASIQEETTFIKRWRLGAVFNRGLEWGLKVPGLVRWTTRDSRCLSTVVLSNLGDPMRPFCEGLQTAEGQVTAGGVRLVRLLFTPPVRSNTRVALGVTETAGRLSVAARFDPYVFTPASGRRFLQRYVQRLETRGGLRS